MATEKLSQFTVASPVISEYVAGATAGSPNKRFLLTSLVSGGPYSMPVPLGPSGGNLTIYCATTGSDSNTGLSPAQAVFTPQRAIDIALLYDYSAGDFTWTVNIANGDYTSQPAGGGITLTLNGTEAENPTITGNGATTTVIGEVVALLMQGNNFINIGLFTTKSGSSIATIWQLGNGGIIINATLVCATSRMDGHVDQIFHSTGPRGAVLFSAVTVTIDASITNVMNLARGTQGSIEFSGPTLVFPGSAVTVTDSILIAEANGFVSFNSVTIANGGNFGPAQSTGFIDLNSDLSFDSTLTLGSGVIFSTDNSNVINRGGSVGAMSGVPTIHRAPATTEIYPRTYGVFEDDTHNNGLVGIYYNINGAIRCTPIGHSINTQTGASYTLALIDQECITEMNNAGANTVTIPTNATVNFPIGATAIVVQAGAGVTSIAGAVGVTLHSAGALTGQWASAKVYQRATDEWVQLNGAF